MKNTFPFLLLFLCVIGCGKFGSNPSSTSSSNSSNSANSAPATPKQIVDLPATFNKSKDEIKKVITATPKAEDPWLEYDLPDASLTYMFDKAGKSNHASFNFKSKRFGDSTISGVGTAEQLATMAGIDIKGKSPASTSALADSYEQELGGKKANIAVYKLQDIYNQIIITSK